MGYLYTPSSPGELALVSGMFPKPQNVHLTAPTTMQAADSSAQGHAWFSRTIDAGVMMGLL